MDYTRAIDFADTAALRQHSTQVAAVAQAGAAHAFVTWIQHETGGASSAPSSSGTLPGFPGAGPSSDVQMVRWLEPTRAEGGGGWRWLQATPGEHRLRVAVDLDLAAATLERRFTLEGAD